MSSEPITLSGQMFTDEAVVLRDAILAASGSQIEFDAAAVKFAGTAVIQVMLAAAASARRDGRGLKILNPSEEWLESLERLGLSSSDIECEVVLQ